MKRTCYGCGARFYDLHRTPIVCPVCGAVYDPERQPRVRKGGTVIRDEPILAPVRDDVEGVGEAVADELVDEEIDDVDDLDDAADADNDDLATEDAELMEDTSELGEDDDDIGEVMEHVDDGLDEKP
jgi:uncharacterized protein (TIGR02300 family)